MGQVDYTPGGQLMRRFLLLLFAVCAGVSAAFSLWPAQLGGYLALFGQHTSVNSGLAITVVAVMTLALVALRVRLWRSERELARVRRDLTRPAAPPYPAYPADPVLSWGPRPLR
jgi:hypothetical protein